MTPAERETVIQFDEASQTASVYTCHVKWQRHLRRLGLEPVAQDQGGETFEVPKSWIRLPRPPRKGTPRPNLRSKTPSADGSGGPNTAGQGVALSSEDVIVRTNREANMDLYIPSRLKENT